MYLDHQLAFLGTRDRGFAMAGLLVSLSIMGLMMAMALPVWSVAAKREREAELIFRGEQYARAIELYQRKVAGAFPADLDMLVDQRYLRRIYEDPMTEDGEFQLILQAQMAQAGGAPETAATPGQQVGRTPETGSGVGQRLAFGEIASGPGTPTAGAAGGIVGVVSKSTEEGLRLYNGRERYNEWVFMPVQAVTQPGGGTGQPGAQPFAQPGQGGAGLGQGFGTVGAGQPGTNRSPGAGGTGGRSGDSRR